MNATASISQDERRERDGVKEVEMERLLEGRPMA